MPRRIRSTQSSSSPIKYKQQTLLAHLPSGPSSPARKKDPKLSPQTPGEGNQERVQSSQPNKARNFHMPKLETVRTRRRRRRRSTAVEVASDSTDVGKIRFEAESSSIQSDSSQDSSEDSVAELPSPTRPAKRQRTLRSESEGSDDGAKGHRNRASRRLVKRGDRRNDPELHSDFDAPAKKKSRLVKGKRPSSGEEDDILDGIDEEKIISSRLRGQLSRKARFMQNLERLKKKKRGQTPSETGDEEYSDTDGLVLGARPTKADDDSETSDVEGESDEAVDDFIVDDDHDAQTATLPAIFSMNTHQDLVHHFKVVCQYLVHLAVAKPTARSRRAERLLSDEYFSMPLSITRRKMADLRDSIASSVWRLAYKKALQAYPEFTLHDLDFAVPHCDACHLGGRLSTSVGRLGGEPYDHTTFQKAVDLDSSSDDDSEEEEESAPPEFNLGRFCARRTSIYHELCHWEYNVFRSLSREVEELSHARRGFVKVAYARGAALPEDISDADQVMEWLDQRGIINAEWVNVKEMMARAINLEADVKRGKQDD